MFELRGASEVFGGGGPVVSPYFGFLRAFADHGFDGKGVSRLHDAVGLVVAYVEYVRRAVEDAADAVAAELLDGLVAVGGDVVLDDGADVLVGAARFAEGDGLLPGVVRDLDEPLAGVVDVVRGRVEGLAFGAADVVHLRAVAVEAVEEDGDVDVDDVALAQRRVVRHAMADHFVHRRADRPGIVVVLQGRRVGPAVDDGRVGDAVELVRRDPRPHGPPGRVQDFPRHFSSSAHLHDVLVALRFDHPRRQEALHPHGRRPRRRVGRPTNRQRHLPRLAHDPALPPQFLRTDVE
mmetsp:Transcript_23081/g.74276  ORF Transcript_23081/g.74276 Transcript_23081/m.74276 type:complete len:293 (-) Transcript_23081:166-1044(-)